MEIKGDLGLKKNQIYWEIKLPTNPSETIKQ